MSRTKFMASLLLAIAVLFAQVGIVAAAPPTQNTTPPPITEIAAETDENGVTTVLVTTQVEGEAPQTVRISLDYALELGLIDPTTQEPVLPENVPPDTTIDPTRVIEVVPPEEPAEDVHPIAEILANFFGEDPAVVNEYHLDGFGFGVIAQAMWVSRNLTGTEDEVGDASLAGDILQAKRDKDFETFFAEHEEFGDVLGDEMPTNWGQFKKLLKEKKQNLGVIVSGQAENDTQNPALQENTDQQNLNNGQDKHDRPEKQKKIKKQKKK